MPVEFPFTSLANAVHLLPGEAMLRRDRNRAYLNRLKTENLLISHYLEAGLRSLTYRPEGMHGGWDSVTSDIRGTVVGHWLSAAARIIAETQDTQLKLRADAIVAEIGRCQLENGGEWAFPIPEKYLHWIKKGKRKWAPQYVCHKNMMGLLDMYLYAKNQQALEIDRKCASWFTRFTGDVTREQMDEMMDFEETGGLMEHWANLYAVTGDPSHLELMRRYERPRLFDPLERGEDVLTNMHANTTIPEVQGAARAYEVTGAKRYRTIVENYWDLAVRQRGTYATGGQTSGEIWTPFGEQSARLGEMNQEHCTVYNLMRLCEYLLRWTGEAEYADYYERNLYNGVFAQGYWQGRSRDMLCEPHAPPTGLVAYFLPLAAGSQKKWGSELDHFWCCHCTLLQANAVLNEAIYYQCSEGLAVCQYQPSGVRMTIQGAVVTLMQTFDSQAGENVRILPVNQQVRVRPGEQKVSFRVQVDRPVAFTIKFRRPWWLKRELQVFVNGQEVHWSDDGHGFAAVHRVWENDEVRVSLAHGITCWPLPDRPNTVAFLDGPVVLAGLVGEERMLFGDLDDPATLLIPDDEREWQTWKNGWRTVDQPVGWRFKPLYEIGNEVYTVYFPVRKPPLST
jgi:DUF1680 family protein